MLLVIVKTKSNYQKSLKAKHQTKLNKPESQNILDPGLAKPQSYLNLGFKIQTWLNIIEH